MKYKKSILITCIFILVLVSLCSGFEYSEDQSKLAILLNMNMTIAQIEQSNDYSGRFLDIYDEAVLATSSDIYYTASVFKNTSDLYDEAKTKIINYNEQIEHLYTEDKEIKNSIEDAQSLVNKGKYEESLLQLKKVSVFLAEKSNIKFQEINTKLENISKGFSLLNQSSDVFIDFKKQLNLAKSRQDIIELDSLEKDLTDINKSLIILISTKDYLKHYSKNQISTKKINDYYEEMLFNFNKQRNERISEIYEDVKKEHDLIINYEEKYGLVEAKINEIFEKGHDDKNFRTMLYESYNYYQKSEFETALAELEKLEDDIVEFESSTIVSFDNDFSLVDFFKENWKKTILFFIVFSVFLFFITKKINRYYVKHRIKKLKLQKKSIIELLVNSQTEYYDKKTISKKLYIQKSLQYQRKLVKITRELALLQSETKNN